MKKIVLAILFLLLLSSSKAFAHGGVQNSAGNVTATFFISPLLPKVNQNSTISFNITDKNTNKRIANYPAILRIKENEDENEDHDKILVSKNVKSDVNGAIQTEFKFPTNKIYDIELEFPQVKDAENEVGFLVQPEQNPSNPNLYVVIALSLLAGIAVGYKLNFLNKS